MANEDTFNLDDELWAIHDMVTKNEYSFEGCATRLDNKGPIHKMDVIAALIAAHGSLFDAGVLLGRSRISISNYVYRNPDVLEVWQNGRDSVVDRIERLHIQAALDGDRVAQKFFLQTLGKDRGYTTRGEIGGPNGEPIAVSFDASALSDDALAELMAARNASTDAQ